MAKQANSPDTSTVLQDNVSKLAEPTDELIDDVADTVRSQIAQNRSEYEGMGNSPEQSVDDVLSDENVREVDVRSDAWQDPKVTVWLRDCPIWANWAGTEKLIRTDGRRDLHYVLDIRPF